MEVFFRGFGQWITNIRSKEMIDPIHRGDPIYPMYSTTLARQQSVCGFFELDRDSEIEHKYNNTLEGAYYLYPSSNHPDRALPPVIDWDELYVDDRMGTLAAVGDSPEDFDIGSYFVIDKSKDFDLKVIGSSTPIKVEASGTERNTMLKLIIGMAIDGYGYDQNNTRNSATGEKNGISAKLKTRGININDDTIRKYLNEAKELI
ncbi:MAG: hypothetical protein HOO92_09770 [Methylococcaceae bacterium]|nr:hypothetical protein [Methylococcaceae bacterium]